VLFRSYQGGLDREPGERPCNWAAYGLFNICPAAIVHADGKTSRVFGFATDEDLSRCYAPLRRQRVVLRWYTVSWTDLPFDDGSEEIWAESAAKARASVCRKMRDACDLSWGEILPRLKVRRVPGNERERFVPLKAV